MVLAEFNSNPAGRLVDVIQQIIDLHTTLRRERADLQNRKRDVIQRRRLEELGKLRNIDAFGMVLGETDLPRMLRRSALLVSLPAAVEAAIVSSDIDSRLFLERLPRMTDQVTSFVTDFNRPFLDGPAPFEGCADGLLELARCDQVLKLRPGNQVNRGDLNRLVRGVQRLAEEVSRADLTADTRLVVEAALAELAEALQSALIGGLAQVDSAISRVMGAVARKPEVAVELDRRGLWTSLRHAIVDISVVVAGGAAVMQIAHINEQPVVVIQQLPPGAVDMGAGGTEYGLPPIFGGQLPPAPEPDEDPPSDGGEDLPEE